MWWISLARRSYRALLAAHAEAHDRQPLGEAGDDQRGDGDQPHRSDEPDLDRVVADDAAVDGLLDRDRHDHPATGADRRDQPRHAEPLAQDRCLLEAAADGVDRREAADRLGHGRASTTC